MKHSGCRARTALTLPLCDGSTRIDEVSEVSTFETDLAADT
jgi:hypothetical protein